MKKVLFATTALVATAGVAAADVAITGGAEMGIAGGNNDTATTFFQSVDVRFTMSGETDNGLTFGAVVDLNDAAEQGDVVDIAGNFADFNVFVSGAFGTLTMGDTDGALDWAMQEVNIGSPGSIADDETGHAGYNGNAGLDGFEDFDGQVLRYDYSVSGFGVAVSLEVDDGGATPATSDLDDATIFGIGANYSMDFAGGSFGVGLGYQVADDVDPALATDVEVSVLGLSGHVELTNGLSAAVNYSVIDVEGANNDGVHVGIGAAYTFDAISVHANWGQYDWDAGAADADAEGYGLAASYDLGGGMTAHLGYGYGDVTAANGSGLALDDESTWSLGLAMSF